MGFMIDGYDPREERPADEEAVLEIIQRNTSSDNPTIHLSRIVDLFLEHAYLHRYIGEELLKEQVGESVWNLIRTGKLLTQKPEIDERTQKPSIPVTLVSRAGH